jgi:hypothetical protein
MFEFNSELSSKPRNNILFLNLLKVNTDNKGSLAKTIGTNLSDFCPFFFTFVSVAGRCAILSAAFFFCSSLKTLP